MYLISDRDGEFRKLRYVNLFTGEKTVISSNIPWDVEELALSRDGHYLAFVSNEGGASKLNLVDLRTHQDLIPPKLPAAGVIDHLGFDADGKRLAFGFSATTSPRDAYVLDVAANRVEAWTHSEAGAVDSAKFVTPRLSQFPTFDRQDGRAREIPVYVYEPAAPGPHPVLLLLHGGPESQFRPRFDPWIQYVVAQLGFAVVAPNVRGSSGYGKSYLALDNGMLRDDAVKDVGALIVWLGSQSTSSMQSMWRSRETPTADYLALAALVELQLRPSASAAWISAEYYGDFISYLTDTAPYRQNQRRAEYGDERDPDMRAYLRRISPLTNAERISRPLLVVHGKNDPRVPPTQADQIVNRLRARGGEVWYLQARDEGDDFRRGSNKIAMPFTVRSRSFYSDASRRIYGVDTTLHLKAAESELAR